MNCFYKHIDVMIGVLEVTNMKVAVIGGGGTGMMMAADLTLRGFEVALFDIKNHAQNILEAKERGYIELIGNAMTGKAKIAKITTDIEEAMREVKYILIAAVVHRQEELINEILPYLRSKQTVCFSAGNAASILLKKKIQDEEILVGEMQGNVYPCRRLNDGRVISAFAYKEKAVAAFPAKDNDKFVESVSPLYSCHSVKNVFQATLNAPNLSIHLPAGLLGVTKMETSEDFRLYRDGICPSVLTLIESLESEKKMIMNYLGYESLSVLEQMKMLMEKEKYPQMNVFRSLEGPNNVQHRYITEDAQAANSLLLSLAKKFGIHAPVCEGLVSIASALNRTDYYCCGRTLEYFGLDNLSVKELNDYLEKGV